VVLVGGVDLAMVDLTWLRRQIGVVFQENVLFNLQPLHSREHRAR
jgi:subfamily B ATP-binding cassette protein HlyB/CyaB